MFKQFFLDWKDKDQSEGLGAVFVTERIAVIQQVDFDASKLHESQHMAAKFNMVDDGSGKTEVRTTAPCWEGRLCAICNWTIFIQRRRGLEILMSLLLNPRK